MVFSPGYPYFGSIYEVCYVFSATMERKGIGGGYWCYFCSFLYSSFFSRDSRISYFLALMVTISALGQAHLCDCVCYGHWILDAG